MGLGRRRKSLKTVYLYTWNAFVITCLIVLACGKEQKPDPLIGPVPSGDKKVTLALFGAPWCTACKEDLPALQSAIDAMTPEQRKNLDVRLYVTTSGNPAVPPTNEVAQQYKESLNLTMESAPDEWRWKKFKAWVGGELVLPGAAVLDADGNVLKSYRAGATTFLPTEIIAFTLQSMK